MKRSEFLKTAGLGIGGFVFGVGLNLGMLFSKKDDWVKANPIILHCSIHHTQKLKDIPSGTIAVKARRSGMAERSSMFLFNSDEFRAHITGMGMIDDHKKLYRVDKPIIAIVEVPTTGDTYVITEPKLKDEYNKLHKI